MTEDASAGRLYADVVADTSGFRRDAEKKLKAALKDVKAQARARVEFSASQARVALNATLREAAKDAKLSAIKAKVTFDPGQVRVALNRALKEASRGADIPTVRVGVEVDDARARAQLARLGGRTSLTVDTDADTRGAEDDIEGMRRRTRSNPVDVPVRVNTSSLSRVGQAIASLTRFPAIASGIAVAAGALANLTGGLFAMGSAAAQAVGVLAAVPNAIGVAAQGIGALVLGFSGVSDAVKAMTKAQEQAGSTAGKTAQQQTAAAQAVRDAQERVTRAQEAAAERVKEAQQRVARAQEQAIERVRAARENLALVQERAAERAADAEQRLADVQQAGARRIVDAQQRVADAHRSTQRAVDDLRSATEAATERAQDLALQLSGAALDEEGAKLALERAANRLRDITGPGSTASSLDRREADLAYRQALQRLAEIRESNEDLAKEKADLDRTGIAGSREVVAAQERVDEAIRAEREARQELREVSRDVARDVADAQRDMARVQRDNARDISEAQRDVLAAQRDGAREVAEAQQALFKAQRDGAREVADAQRDVARALASSAAGAGTANAAMTALNTAMNNLSPAGQRFARFVKDTLQPRFKELKFAVQDALLPPLQEAIRIGLPLLDVIEKGMVGTGRVIGGLAIDLAKLVTGPAFKKDVGDIMASNNRAMFDFGKAGLAIIDILRRIAVVAGPVLLEPFARWVRAMAEAANTSKALTKSRIADFLERAKNTAKTLGGILGDVAVGLYNIGRLARPSGDTLLGSLAASAEAFRKATEDPANQERIRKFFENTVPIMQQFGDLLNRVAELFFRLGEITGGGTLDGLFWILNRILDVLEGITSLPGGGAVLTAILTLSGVGLGLGLVAKGLGSIVDNVKRLAKYTGVSKLLGAIANTKAGTAVTSAVRALPGKAGGAIKKGAQAAGGAVKRGAQAAGGAVVRGGASVASSVAGSAVGQAAAAGLARAGGAAKTAAQAVSGFVAQLARTASAAVLGGLRAVGGAIASVAGAAWRGVSALGALALAHARAGLAAAASAAKQLLVAAAQKVIRLATLAWAAAQRVLNLVLKANPIGLIITAVAALVAGIIWAYKNVGWFRDAVNAAFKFIGQVATWLWENAIKPAFYAIRDFIVNTLGPKILWFHKNVVEPAFKAIGDAASWLWNKIIKPAFQGWELLFKNVIGPAISWLWNSIIKPVFTLIGGFIKTIVGGITGSFDLVKKGLSQMGSAWSAIWNGIKSLISVVWNNGIKPVFEILKKGMDLVGRAFETGAKFVRDAWSKIKEYAKTPARFVIETVLNNGILAAWNKVADFFNLSPKGLRVNLPPGFARGGIYPGYTPGKDIGIAAVSGGEAIMRPEWTRAVGADYVNAMNAMARTGGVASVRRAMAAGMPFMGGFDSGGIVEGIKSFFGKAKDLFVGGVRKAAASFVNPLLDAIEQKMGGGAFARGLTGIPRRAISGFLTWLEGREGDFGGDRAGVVKAAAKYVGRGDGTDGFSGSNNNIFNRKWGMGAGTPWCANFVSTAVSDAKAGKHYAGYPTAAVYGYWSRMKKVGVADAKPGDLGVYGRPDINYGANSHINVVEKKTGKNSFTTIGGNENSLVRRSSRNYAFSILRPTFATGGVVDRHVFQERNEGFDHDRNDPLYQMLSRMSPNMAMRVSTALAKARWMQRDSGGPLYPGFNTVLNDTGALEWVLTPEAVRMLGGPAAVQALNDRARVSSAGRSNRATAITRSPAATASGSAATVNVFPQPGQSEHEIGMVAARKLGQMLR